MSSSSKHIVAFLLKPTFIACIHSEINDKRMRIVCSRRSVGCFFFLLFSLYSNEWIMYFVRIVSFCLLVAFNLQMHYYMPSNMLELFLFLVVASNHSANHNIVSAPRSWLEHSPTVVFAVHSADNSTKVINKFSLNLFEVSANTRTMENTWNWRQQKFAMEN